jgi:hypothetical protein
MQFIDLIMLFDFMQVLNIKRKHPIKNEYFPIHILFSTIYLLQELKLNHNNYSKQKINMSNFVQGDEHDVHMYAKFEDFTFYDFFVIKYSNT